jgi:hypothetical protein
VDPEAIVYAYWKASKPVLNHYLGRQSLLVILLLLLSGGLGSAQSWNRAVFRGDEIEPRDFSFNDEYFLNLLSYRPWPDWQSIWAGSERGYLLTVGSVRSDEFYLYQAAKLHLDVAEGVRFHYDLLEHEDLDSRYLRHRPTLAFPFHEQWTVYAFGEGGPVKEDNDVGVGAIFHPGPHHRWELQLTGVDFNEAKGKEGRRFSQDAYAALLKNEIPISEKVRVGSAVELQLPLTLVDPGENLTFRFKKRLYEGYLRWRTGDRSELFFDLSAEDTGKDTRYSSLTPTDQRLSRNAFRANMEYRFYMETPLAADCRLGFDYFHFRERNLFPEDPLTRNKLERNEYTLYGGLSIELSERFLFRPALYVDYVSHNRLFPEDEIRNDRFNGIQSKLSTALEIRFKETIRLAINPNLDLDQMNWGGGNVQLIALF